MSTLPTRFVLYWFAALIPPPSPEEDIDYYEVLGVSPKATKEEIRKAYKKKSLTLHPDKILQRGGNPDDFRKEYQDIQEAHAVLTDDKKRQTYNMVNKSSTRYKFLTEEGAVAAGYEHLGKATCEQKSRLVLLLAILILVVLMQPILICVKINQELQENGGPLESAPWMTILIPWWIINFFYLIAMLLITLISGCNIIVIVKLLETMASIASQILLALRWDQIVTNDYVIIFIPIYLTLAFRWLGRYLIMRQTKFDILRMITLPKLEQEIGKKYEDLTEEEQLELQEEFIIVHLPPDAPTVQAAFGEDFVQLSPEYQMAMETYYDALSGLILGMVFGIPMTILLVLKIDQILNISWWLIFLPAWIYLGTQMLWNCYGCCCSAVGDEILGGMESDDEAAAEEDNDVQDEDEGMKDSRGSGAFVKPESDMNDFNEKKPEKMKEEMPVETLDAKTTSIPSDPAVPAEPTQTTTTSIPSPPSDNPTADPNIIEETDMNFAPDSPHSNDNEPYHDFEEAYEQAEASAIAAQAKATSSLCGLSLQLMLLCLIVGKLEQDVPHSSSDSVGYNAMWILFPILMISGCILCCWACLIYGAGKEGLDHLVDRATAGDKKANDEEAPSSPTSKDGPVAMPPPPPPPNTTTTTAAEPAPSPLEETKADETPSANPPPDDNDPEYEDDLD